MKENFIHHSAIDFRQISYLSAEAVSGFTADQIAWFSSSTLGACAGFTASQIEHIWPSKFNSFTSNCLNRFTNDTVSGTTALAPYKFDKW